MWFRVGVDDDLLCVVLKCRVEVILGPNWATHLVGRSLKTEVDSFRAKLNSSRLYERWVKDKMTQLPQLKVIGHLFKIVANNKQTYLSVNFDKAIVALIKGTRHPKF